LALPVVPGAVAYFESASDHARPGPLFLRPTVIGGDVLTDDYSVIHDARRIGRSRKAISGDEAPATLTDDGRIAVFSRSTKDRERAVKIGH
jgi:hypothetical protein